MAAKWQLFVSKSPGDPAGPKYRIVPPACARAQKTHSTQTPAQQAQALPATEPVSRLRRPAARSGMRVSGPVGILRAAMTARPQLAVDPDRGAAGMLEKLRSPCLSIDLSLPRSSLPPSPPPPHYHSLNKRHVVSNGSGRDHFVSATEISDSARRKLIACQLAMPATCFCVHQKIYFQKCLP